MKPVDREEYIRRYEERLNRYGYSPQSLGWGVEGRQEIRFSVLTAPVLARPASSVLDVGCGFADLYDYLIDRGWQGSYTGIDLVPGLVQVARERHPGLDLHVTDLAEFASGSARAFDFVIASGTFNGRLHGESNLAHLERSLREMFGLCRTAVCVDFLSSHVDYQQEIAWHTDPAWAVTLAANITPRFLLRHDYMPYEFALQLFAESVASSRRVFEWTEADPETHSAAS